jgi:hypothetical protein
LAPLERTLTRSKVLKTGKRQTSVLNGRHLYPYKQRKEERARDKDRRKEERAEWLKLIDFETEPQEIENRPGNLPETILEDQPEPAGMEQEEES